MRFWDSSALVALILEEPASQSLETLLTGDRDVLMWWGSPVECQSALYRRKREGVLAGDQSNTALQRLAYLTEDAHRVPPIDQVLQHAGRMLASHPLRAADAFQIAAAITWCEGSPQGRIFVCLDDRLRAAAQAEGFTVLPDAA